MIAVASASQRVSARLTWPLFRLFRADCAAGRELVAALEISPRRLADPDALIDYGSYCRALSLAAVLRPQEAIGLAIGAATRQADLGLFPYLVATAESGRHAVDAAARHLPLLCEPAGLRVVEDGELARIELSLPDAPAVCMDAWVGALLAAVAGLVSPRGSRPAALPRQIWRTHTPRRHAERYRATWAAPVRFGAPCDALVVSAAALDRPLGGADAEVHRMLEGNARRTLARREEQHPWTARVRWQIRLRLAAGTPRNDDVARALGLSRATLNRRLAAEGTQFKEVVDRVRAELATRYLVERELTIAEIADTLGFANVAAFHRAFRRWTSDSPGRFRERALSQNGVTL